MGVVTQEKIVDNLDNLTSSTVNFPSVIHEAVQLSIINRAEKDVILKKYKSVYDKLTTFYLLASSKGSDVLNKFPALFQCTGNSVAADLLTKEQGETESSDEEDSSANHQTLLLNNLDRLCSHTMNSALVLAFATGLELISGNEREIITNKCRSEEDQLTAFYTLVASKGEAAFENLIQVLRMTSNFWALEVLKYHEGSYLLDE